MSDQNTVVITGLGLFTALGEDLRTVGNCLFQGRTAIRPIEHYLPGRGGAVIQNYIPEERIRPKRILKFINRATTYALIAAQNAWSDADLLPNSIAAERFGIYTGTGESEMKPELFFPGIEKSLDAQGQFNLEHFANEGMEELDPYTGLISLGNNALCYISIAHNLKGPSNNYVKSGVSSSQALGEAVRAIRHGYADAAMVVGVDCLTDPWAYSAYDSVSLLCTETSDIEHGMRPFDKKRHGFMPGEGAGALVLESAQSAKARNAYIYGTVLGYGEATDVFSMSTVPPDGGKLSSAIEEAIKDAGIEPEDIDLILAHGNATAGGDHSEAQGIYKAVNGSLRSIPVAATKPYTGHLGAASGAVETILGLIMSQRQAIAPILNLTHPDEICPLSFVMHTHLERKIAIFMDISRSIGGQNAVLLVSAS